MDAASRPLAPSVSFGTSNSRITANDFDHMLCCELESLCGYSLRKGIVIVGVTTIVIACITLLVSIVGITTNNYEVPYNNRPVAGVGLLFGLYCYGIASYQIFVSSLLLWTTIKKGGSPYACTLWYISHISIILGYVCFFIAGTVTCFAVHKYFYGAMIFILGVFYVGTFSYFCAVVSSYSYTIREPVYY